MVKENNQLVNKKGISFHQSHRSVKLVNMDKTLSVLTYERIIQILKPSKLIMHLFSCEELKFFRSEKSKIACFKLWIIYVSLKYAR